MWLEELETECEVQFAPVRALGCENLRRLSYQVQEDVTAPLETLAEDLIDDHAEGEQMSRQVGFCQS